MECCITCGNKVKKRHDKPARPASKYCSAKCKKIDCGVDLDCLECGKTYRVIKSRANISKYCSRTCTDKAQTIYEKAVKQCSFCGGNVDITKENRRSTKVYCDKKCLDSTRNHKKIQECANCKTEFTAQYKGETGLYNKYCCVACYRDSHNETVKCDCCGTNYSRNLWAATKNRSFKVCSRECHTKYTQGGNSPNYNHDNEYVVKGGLHRQIRTPDGWRQEHRVLVEDYIGRKLAKGSEPILHINGNNLDNRPTNLYVCMNISEMATILNNSNAPYPVSSNLEILKIAP